MRINNSIQAMASMYGSSNRINRAVKSYGQGDTAGDDIQISTEGQQFNELLQKLRSGSEVRMDKVTEYENLLAAGTYSVSNSDLAEKILQYQY